MRTQIEKANSKIELNAAKKKLVELKQLKLQMELGMVQVHEMIVAENE